MRLSLDDKTSIQARSRKHPGRLAAPGRPARQEFEYIRHGTVSIIAAMDIDTGQVLTEPIERNTAATFTAFLDALDTAIDPAKQIDLVPGQRFQSHCQAHQSLVQGPPALAPALDAATRLVAEHDRDLVLHPGQTRDPPRRLPQSARPC